MYEIPGEGGQGPSLLTLMVTGDSLTQRPQRSLRCLPTRGSLANTVNEKTAN